MGHERGRIALTMALALVAVAVSGCSADPASWRVQPLLIGDTGDDSPRDVAFTTWNLTDDTAGGVWGESSGSWFRVSADGARTRFNEGEGQPLIDIAALSSTQVYVVLPIGSGPVNTRVELFDTVARTFTPVLGRSRVTDAAEPLRPYAPDGMVGPESAFGAVRAIDVDSAGRLVFVERTRHPTSDPDTYVVRRLDRSGSVETLAGRAPAEADVDRAGDAAQAGAVALTAASVSISAGAEAGVVISTPDAVFRVDEHGISTTLAGALPPSSARRTVAGIAPRPYAVRPVDANAAGELILVTGKPATAAETAAAGTPWHFDGGSGRFRELVARRATWSSAQDPGDLVLSDAAGTPRAPLAPLGSARLGVWTSASQFVIVVPGSGDESALARITVPSGRG
jgi:hypothetical protein